MIDGSDSSWLRTVSWISLYSQATHVTISLQSSVAGGDPAVLQAFLALDLAAPDEPEYG